MDLSFDLSLDLLLNLSLNLSWHLLSNLFSISHLTSCFFPLSILRCYKSYLLQTTHIANLREKSSFPHIFYATEADQGISASTVAIMDELQAKEGADIPIWDETTLPGSSAGSVSYPAIIAQDTEEGPRFPCQWQGEEPGIKLRIAPLVQTGCYSYLKLCFIIRFWVPSQEEIMLTTGHLFLTTFYIELIQARPVIAEGEEKPPAGVVTAHASLYEQHSHLREAINDRSVWMITVSQRPNVQLHAANLFCHRSFGDQDALITQIRQHLRNQQLRFFIWGYEVDKILLQLNAQLSEEANNNPLSAWYPAHQRKVFLQIGDYPDQDNRPLVTRSTKPSFFSWEEYVTLLGYSLIYEHEHIEGLLKSLADTTAMLKVIKIL